MHKVGFYSTSLGRLALRTDKKRLDNNALGCQGVYGTLVRFDYYNLECNPNASLMQP